MATKKKSTGRQTFGEALGMEVRDDGVAMVTFDVPGQGQNTLKEEFNDSFLDLLDHLERDEKVRAAVFTSGKPDSFLAGADVGMLGGVKTAKEASALSRSAQEVMDRLASLRVPVVAAIHGPCLGGGLELALACAARVCSDSPKTKLAVPEVQLGLLPGAGGTQRLPRLVGVSTALDMLLTGRNIRPKKARSMGLVDEVVRRSILEDVAVEYAVMLADAREQDEAPGRWERFGDALKEYASAEGAQKLALEENPLGRRVLFQQARKRTLGKTRGNYPAAERILDVVEIGLDEGMDAGLDAEAKHFGELVVSPEAAELMYLFQASTALKKDPGVDAKGVKARPVRTVGVLGGGLMGSGIAYVSVEKAKADVRIKDKDVEGVNAGLRSVWKLWGEKVKRRRLSHHDAEQKMSRITGTTGLDGFRKCDMVVEAVFEDADLKRTLFSEVEPLLHEDAVLASNTSSIAITELAEGLKRPQNFLGMHYFSPVEKMPLLEIIVTEETSDEATATAVAFGKKQGKTVIVVRDAPGFYTTRILAPYMNEAVRILSEGVPIEHLDKALLDWGFPIGPMALADEVGFDVAAKVGPILRESYGDRFAAPAGMEKLFEEGRRGKKNRFGFYAYDKGDKEPDETVYETLGVDADNRLDPELIAERCALLMVNEAAWCLDQGVLRSPRDGDIGAVFGLGFPPFRGGPFRYMDARGAAAVVRRLDNFAARFGARFEPAPLLRKKADDDERFHQA
ncbi:MAG: fatty acid oxidation complex subunit alpha FadJ [Myxococcota bacterium]